MSEARYGVVIPAYNAALTIGDAIESALQQTPRPGSIVVVDDGSTDRTRAIVRSFGDLVTLVTQEHRGAAAATDNGFARIDEPFVAGLDADDLWLAGKALRQLAVLDEAPWLDGVFCRACVFAHGGLPDRRGPVQDLWGRSALMIRRSALDRCGEVEAGVGSRGEMVDWIARSRELGVRLHLIKSVLVARRLIPGSLSHGQDASALLPAVRAALARKRR